MDNLIPLSGDISMNEVLRGGAPSLEKKASSHAVIKEYRFVSVRQPGRRTRAFSLLYANWMA